MSKILITGCSSGFGLETAKFFLDRGWNVVATMRTPNAEVLPASDHLQVLALDVTDAAQHLERNYQSRTHRCTRQQCSLRCPFAR